MSVVGPDGSASPGGGQPLMQGTRKGHRGLQDHAASLGLLLRCGPGQAAQPGQETLTKADSQPLRTCSPGPGVDTVLPGARPRGGWKWPSPSSKNCCLLSPDNSACVHPQCWETLFRAETLKAAIWYQRRLCRLVCTHTHTHYSTPQ